MSVEASPPVNLVVGLPDPPLPGSKLPADVGVLPPLNSAIGVDFGTETEPWLSVHSSTQTVPLSTSDSEMQTTPAPSADFGSQTILPPKKVIDAGIQTAPALPKVDCEIQTEHQELLDVIRQEYTVLLDSASVLRYFTAKEHVATAKEIFNVHLPRLNTLRQWLLAEDKKAREHGWQPVRIFDGPFVQLEPLDPPFDQIF
jgi:hypothetical protein